MITNERDDADLWFAIASGLLLLIAAAIRFRLLGATLFEDEVWVAELVRNGGWHAHSWSTPPLFYAIGREWTSLRGVSNAVLREPAAMFGVAVCILPFFAPLPRVSRFAWAVLLAFSSPLLFYSARIKQYTIEAFAVTLLIVLFLHVRKSESVIAAIAFFIAGAIAVMTLYAPVFVLVPMAILSIRRPRMLGGFIVLFALFALAYLRWLAPGPESIRLHGDMNAYFAANGRWITSPRSFLVNTMHWSGQAMNLVRYWWLAVVLLILAWLIRERNLAITMLAFVPPLIIAAASIVHRYPYGEVRLMIVCLPALYLLIADAIASVSRRVPLLLLLLAPFVFAGVVRDPYNATYMHIDDLRPMFDLILRSHFTGEPVYADPSFAAPLRYGYPALATSIHSGAEPMVMRPGWYIQYDRGFNARGATVVMRIGNVIAVRSGS